MSLWCVMEMLFLQPFDELIPNIYSCSFPRILLEVELKSEVSVSQSCIIPFSPST